MANPSEVPKDVRALMVYTFTNRTFDILEARGVEVDPAIATVVRAVAEQSADLAVMAGLLAEGDFDD